MDVKQPLKAFEQDGVEEVNLGQHVLAEFFECDLGQHVLAEFFECDPNILNSIDKVEKYMIDAALECGATIVQKCFHMFNPYGVSGVVIISESHLAIHTWPELGYAAVDLFTCGDKCDPKISYEFIPLPERNFHRIKKRYFEQKYNESFRKTVRNCRTIMRLTVLAGTLFGRITI